MPFHPKMIEELKAAAPDLSIELNLIAARTAQQLSPAFAAIARAHDQALYLIPDGLFFDRRAVILNMAAKARLPAIYWQKDFVDEG